MIWRNLRDINEKTVPGPGEAGGVENRQRITAAYAGDFAI